MESITAVTTTGQQHQLSQADIDELQSQTRGRILLPADDLYNERRLVWNGMIDRKPALIARCTGTADVVAAVNFGRKHDLRISIRSGGHHVTGKAVCDQGLVIDLSQMRGVRVDTQELRVQVGGGATLGDVDHETSLYGLAAPLGVVSATGVAGLTLHGGYGWLTRRCGLSSDNLLSAEVVTAKGEVVRASADQNEDLYWALRGGGGNFGIVTNFEYCLYPVGANVWFLLTIYPIDKGKEGLRLFRDYMPQAPEELGAIAVFWNAPDLDVIPEEYRGKPVYIIAGCHTGSPAEGEKAIAPFRQMGTPIADLSGRLPFKDVQRFLDADYPDGRQYYWKSSYLNTLDDKTIDMLVEKAAQRPSPISSLDVWALGGQVNRIDPKSTAFSQRKAQYMIGIEANWDNPAEAEANMKWTKGVYEDLPKNLDAGLYLNFPGFGEEGQELLKKTYGPNYDRLKKVKSKWDPDNFFKGFIEL